MSGSRVAYSFPSDAATVLASTQAFQLGVENLFTQSPSSKWQVDGSQAAETVTIDMGAAVSIQFFALLGHDFEGDETGLTISGNASDSWGAPSFSQSITHRTGTLVEFFASAQSYRWWRFAFTKANAADLRSAGRLLLAPYYELPNPPSRSGHSWGWTDTTTTGATRSGVRYSDTGARARTLRMSMNSVPEAQIDVLNEIALNNGTGIPLVVSIDHDNEPLDWFLYGTLSRLVSQRYVSPDAAGGHRWGIDLEMIEAL